MWFFLGLLIAVPAPSAADDPVRAKLDAAKATYEADVGKYKTLVTAWLDKREEAARKAGDKKAVDQVKSERSAFEMNGEPPAALPATIRTQLSTARANLESAYKAAVVEYTRLKRDELAAAAEKEWAELQPRKPDAAAKVEDRIVGRVWSTGTARFEFKPGGIVLVNGKPARHWAKLGPDRVVSVDDGQNYDLYIFDKEFSSFRAYFLGRPGKDTGFVAKMVQGK